MLEESCVDTSRPPSSDIDFPLTVIVPDNGVKTSTVVVIVVQVPLVDVETVVVVVVGPLRLSEADTVYEVG